MRLNLSVIIAAAISAGNKTACYRPHTENEMSTFQTKDGVTLWFKDWGSGQPVLFSHGWPLDADMWDSQLTFLAERGYRVIAFDRRGFGRSEQPWEGYNYDTFADDIHDLIEHLQLEEITLVGFSMGGGDVTRYIGRYGSAKVKSLVLLGAVTPVFGRKADHPEGPEQAVFDDIRAGLRQDRAQFISDFATPFYGLNAGQQVSNGVLTQTLVIHGSNDQVVPFEATGKLAHEMIKHSQLKVYDNAPHGFAVTHQDRLNADLLAFLQQQK